VTSKSDPRNMTNIEKPLGSWVSRRGGGGIKKNLGLKLCHNVFKSDKKCVHLHLFEKKKLKVKNLKKKQQPNTVNSLKKSERIIFTLVKIKIFFSTRGDNYFLVLDNY
jgi:hypothetical protein